MHSQTPMFISDKIRSHYKIIRTSLFTEYNLIIMAINSNAKHSSPVVKAKREKAKKRIASQVLPMFFDKGYDNTTIKDIEQVTGLKAGSIYNLFEDKYDILRECFRLVYGSAFNLSKEMLNKEADVVSSLAFPLALELFAASSDPTIAQLIDEGYHSRVILEDIIRIKTEWVRDFTILTATPLNGELRHNMLAVIGAIGNYASEYRYNPHKDYSKELKTVLTIFCTLFEIPCGHIDRIAEDMVNELGTGNFDFHLIQNSIDLELDI